MSELAAALLRAAEAVQGGDDGQRIRRLSRGGVMPFELDLSDSKLAQGKELEGVRGYGLRFLRHGSSPGGRLELSFGGNVATKFFAPGMIIRGGFDNVTAKRAKQSARIGKVTLAVLNDPDADLGEDLVINALGPQNLLGACDDDGNPVDWVTVDEDTDPDAAYGTQVGAFDGTGWELLRVLVKATDVTAADVHFFFNPSWTGTTWFHASVDGPYIFADSPTTGHDWRVFTVPWAGRGVGCPAVYNLAPGALTGLDFIIQGIR